MANQNATAALLNLKIIKKVAFNMEMNTIAAIATAPGMAGISIIRVSGQKAIEIVDTIF